MRISRLELTFAAAILLAGCAAGGEAPLTASADIERGRLLYETNCAACHSAQAHWRSQRVVQSWTGLVAEVTRWQAVAGANWGRAEIEDVAAYLNQRYYGLPCPRSGCGAPRV